MDTQETMTERNKAIVRRFFEAFGRGDHNALEDVVAPDFVAYSHGSPDPQERSVHLQNIAAWNAAFAETHFTIDEQIAEGNKVASRVMMRAVHSRGDFMGIPPTGNLIESSAVTIERIESGRIVERRVISDWSALMRQLSQAPALGGR